MSSLATLARLALSLAVSSGVAATTVGGEARPTSAPSSASDSGAAGKNWPSHVIAIGASHVLDYHQSGEFGLEHRFARVRPLPLRPIVGFSANELGSFWGFAGLRLEWRIWRSLTLAPNFSIVLYEKGDGRDLGGPLEFRSGIDLGIRIRANWELGLSFYHLSNGRFYSSNPGTESLVLTWGF